MRNLYMITTFVGLILTLSETSLGATIFEFNRTGKIKAQISEDNINRIEFEGYKIVEVIGDESKYQLFNSELSNSIFILPKAKKGSILSLSMVNVVGEAQDLELEVAKKIRSQTIIVRSKANKQIQAQKEDEVALMLKSMAQGIRGKYYVTEVKRKLSLPTISFKEALELGLKTRQRTDLVVTQNKSYQYGDLIGASLIVSNQNPNKDKVYIEEEDFSNLFSNTIATSISTNIIPAKGYAQVLIVTREKRDVR